MNRQKTKNIILIMLSLVVILSMLGFSWINKKPDLILTDPNGLWVDSRAFNSLSDVIDAIGSTETTLLVTRNESVSADLTIPSTCTLKIDQGAVITVANTKTLTINGSLDAGAYQIFDGSGSVSLPNQPVVPINWFSTSASAISAIEEGSVLEIWGDWDVGTKGVISTDKPITITGHGLGKDGSSYDGGRIINTGSDVVDSPVILFDGGVTLREGPRVEHLYIEHEGSTSYAVQIDHMIRSNIEDCYIDMLSTGYGGVTYIGSSYFASMEKTVVRNAVNYCVYVSGTGSEHTFNNCQISTPVASAVAFYTDRKGTRISGGEYSASGASAVAIKFYNTAAATYDGGTISDVFIENVAATGDGIFIDGDTNRFQNIEINNLRADLGSNTGSLVKFGLAYYCVLVRPKIENSGGGGVLAEFTSEAQSCGIVADYIDSVAPITVDASATRCYMSVEGLVARTSASSITTDTNLRVTLVDGIDDLPPGFVPVHNGTAWNYWFVSLSDDTASSFTPPTQRGIATVLTNDKASMTGIITFDADSSTAECEALGAASDFEVTTGVLEGTTGTNAKTTLSAHTDGKVYLENRGGSEAYTVLFKSASFNN